MAEARQAPITMVVEAQIQPLRLTVHLMPYVRRPKSAQSLQNNWRKQK